MSEYKWQWPAVGHDKVIDFLERAGRNNKIAQTYIFSGRDELGKIAIALAFARNLQGGRDGFDSDLLVVEREPDKKFISINQAREFIKRLHLSSFLNSYKIGIIKEAELLSEEAKSALLKTLEEPQAGVVIILLVNDEQDLPSTIISRAQILHFQPVPSAVVYDYLIDNYNTKRALAKDIANLSLGRPLVAVYWLEHPEEYDKHLVKSKIWLEALALDVNGRLAALDKLFNDRSWSSLALSSAEKILDLAEGLTRDLFLLGLGQPERLQNSAVQSELEIVWRHLENSSKAPLVAVIGQLKLVAQAREYLSANVNPRLVLEQLIINI